MNVRIDDSWKEALTDQWQQPYFEALVASVKIAYASSTVYPPGSEIFKAFDLCPLPDTKVVILGQDPYHGEGQAMGLSFSVREGVQLPPSLLNIYKEIKDDLGIDKGHSGDLTSWAKQGVLLLNSTLTVERGRAGSHQAFGWETFTDAVVKCLSDNCSGLVFMLWGSYAIAKGRNIDRSKHLVLTAPHPSPLSAYRGFFGCKHFSQTNNYLIANGKTPINW